jgi:hypothetical protein
MKGPHQLLYHAWDNDSKMGGSEVCCDDMNWQMVSYRKSVNFFCGEVDKLWVW